MKKSILLGLGAVAMAMGVGATVAGSFESVISAEVQATGEQTIYLKINNENWKPHSFTAEIQNSENPKPHVAFSPVDGEDDLYFATSSYFADSAYVKFVRGNGSGTYWDYSNEIKIEGFNYFTIDGSGWNSMNPGVGVYGLDNGTYLYGTFNNWSKHDSVLTGAVSDKTGYQIMFKDAEFPVETQMKVIYVTDRVVAYGGDVKSPSQVESDDEDNYPAYDYGQQNAYITAAGTYDVYVNTTTNFYSFVTPTTKDAAEAFGTYFLTNIECDSNGVNVPSGWSDVSDAYGDLTPNAKHIVVHAEADKAGTNLEKAMATYDWAITHNPNLKDSAEAKFITDRVPSGAVSVNSFAPVNSTNPSAVVVAAIAGVGLAAAVTMIFIAKKRKEN